MADSGVPPNDAVTIAFWLEVTDSAVAVKVALVAPKGMVIEAGTARLALLSERVINAPPLRAAAFRSAVQIAVPGVFMVLGTHVRDVRIGGMTAPIIVPPVPEEAIIPPVAPTTETLATLMAVLLTPEAIVTFTIATTPFAIRFAFMPVARHVYVPVPATQFRVLPALVAAAPADAEIDVTADGENVSVH